MSSSACVLMPFGVRAAYTDLSCSILSIDSDAKNSRPAVRRSPPEPFTHRTRSGLPVSGSFSMVLLEVLPPPVFVTRWSSPRRFER